MTDKEQIIIDGVDVKNCKGIDLGLFPLAKCKFLKFKTSDGGIAGIWCSDHTNCYFKQLARKTQECEELKEENENLRNSLSDSLMFKFTSQDNELINKTAECKKYKQALNEIENYINSQGIDNKWNMYIQRFRSGILNIINKAKDGNNE